MIYTCVFKLKGLQKAPVGKNQVLIAALIKEIDIPFTPTKEDTIRDTEHTFPIRQKFYDVDSGSPYLIFQDMVVTSDTFYDELYHFQKFGWEKVNWEFTMDR